MINTLYGVAMFLDNNGKFRTRSNEFYFLPFANDIIYPVQISTTEKIYMY